MATALRLRPGPGGLADRIVEVLAVRRVLLVVDNCEHVADAAAGLVEAVARGAPGVDLLATSREPLRVDGEHVLPVAPLTPDAAAALLTDRLAAGGPTARPGPELCRRLDHLPLALELAAGRAGRWGARPLAAWTRTGRSRCARRPPHRRRPAPLAADLVAWSYGRSTSRSNGCRAARGVRRAGRAHGGGRGVRGGRHPAGLVDRSRSSACPATRTGSGCWRRCARSAAPGSPGIPPPSSCGNGTRRGRRASPTSWP